MQFMEAWQVAYNGGVVAAKAIKSQQLSLGNLRTRWEKEYGKFYDSSTKIRARLLHQAGRFKRVSFAMLRGYKQLQSDHAAEMQRMEKAFSTDMQLRAAEKFWAKKRRLNRQRAKAALQTMWTIGILGGVVLIGIYYGLFKLLGEPPQFSVSHALAYFVPTLLFVWLLRIFGTEYKTNKNMADDAEEREAMVMTFKALEFEKRVGDEERIVILNALFRPHGNTSEETVPAPVWDAVLGRLPTKQ
jgi:hypothetical protein